jgi:hypothetical protein
MKYLFFFKRKKNTINTLFSYLDSCLNILSSNQSKEFLSSSRATSKNTHHTTGYCRTSRFLYQEKTKINRLLHTSTIYIICLYTNLYTSVMFDKYEARTLRTIEIRQ